MKNLLFALFLVCSLLRVGAQSDTTDTYDQIMSSSWTERGMSFGIQYSKYLYGEIGYFKSFVLEAGGFPYASTVMNYSCEFTTIGNDLILGPKIQGRIHLWTVNLSLASIFYTKLNSSYALKLRPEIGIGLWNFDLNYGYNIGLMKNDLEQVNKHIITFRKYLNFQKKDFKEFDENGVLRVR